MATAKGLMRTIYYVFLFVSLLLLLFFLNFVRWLFSSSQLALHSLHRGHSGIHPRAIGTAAR